MKCREYRGGLIEWARGGAIEEPARRALETHVAGCEACARFLEAQMELSAATSALNAMEIPPHEQFEARVMAEFDAAQPVRIPARRWVLAGALAASLCLGAVWIERGAHVERSNVAVEAEDVRPFLNIPYTVPLAPEEPAALVRTRIPVNQLIAAGFHLEVSSMDPEAVIEADVLVGQDGRARAIRPVSILMSN
jgi:hypothetical protein